MNFLADESVDQQIVDRLRQDGHSVVYVAEMDPGIDDKGVLNLANQQMALLITADKGFGELVFRQHLVSKGVVLVRLAGLSPAGKGETVSLAIRQHESELSEAFSVVSPGMFRIRRRT
jgi:predicted nuclease of predicted toxin-antitoxin system